MEAEAGERFPNLVTARKSDLCYATTNRQDAVGAMTGECDLILVVGSMNSSNTNALVRTANVLGTRAYRIDSADGIRPDWLDGADVVGVSAGASVPDYLVQEVLERLDPGRRLGPVHRHRRGGVLSATAGSCGGSWARSRTSFKPDSPLVPAPVGLSTTTARSRRWLRSAPCGCFLARSDPRAGQPWMVDGGWWLVAG